MTLGKLTSFMTSGSRGWAKYYTRNSKEGRLFLRIQNVKNNQLLLDDIAFVEPPDSAETRRTQVKEGDVLIRVTADLGRTAVIPHSFPTAYINQHLVIVRVDKNMIDSYYLSAFLTYKGGEKQFNQLNREAVKAGLNFDDIKKLNILLPPPELQTKFVSLQNSIYECCKQYKFGIEESSHLFKSLLQKAFRGEL